MGEMHRFKGGAEHGGALKMDIPNVGKISSPSRVLADLFNPRFIKFSSSSTAVDNTACTRLMRNAEVSIAPPIVY